MDLGIYESNFLTSDRMFFVYNGNHLYIVLKRRNTYLIEICIYDIFL